jgi:DNA-directed RNA polymerase subunit RPC12/RpoP
MPVPAEGERVKCPRCRSRQLVKIEMTVAGEQLMLKSCSACDVRWWEDRGEHLPLADVLELAAILRR